MPSSRSTRSARRSASIPWRSGRFPSTSNGTHQAKPEPARHKQSRANPRVAGGLRVDRALAYEASLECIRNSKQLLDHGRVLFQKKSYGHTFALLVLAEEELGKAFLWILQTIGVDIPKGILTRDHVAKQ